MARERQRTNAYDTDNLARVLAQPPESGSENVSPGKVHARIGGERESSEFRERERECVCVCDG